MSELRRKHFWLWLHVIGGWQIIRCRYCGKHEQYRPMGFATVIPEGFCDEPDFWRPTGKCPETCG